MPVPFEPWQSISESSIVTLPLFTWSAQKRAPDTLELRMMTPVALIVRQPVVLPSITVFDVVMFDGPVYAVSVVPAGTPVFEASGKPVEVGPARMVRWWSGAVAWVDVLPAVSMALTPTV